MDSDKNLPRIWSEISYAGEKRVPFPEEPDAGSWPTYFLRRDVNGEFTDLNNNPIVFKIRHPNTINFDGEQLNRVKQTLKNLTPDQITKAEYWNAGPPTKQFTPIIDRLIDSYGVSALRAARILALVQTGINDTLIVTWHFKYRWEIARPNQLDQELETITCTPRFPSYPAGHASVAGCAETILSYFFPSATNRLRELAEECAQSRVYAGVHYPVDCEEGLRLGRYVGDIIVSVISEQRDINSAQIDFPFTGDLHVILPPPPYEQVIKFPRERKCSSKLDPRQDPSAR